MKFKRLLITVANMSLLASMSLFAFCKKDKKTDPEPATPSEPATTEIASGLPANKSSINGYLYATVSVTYANMGFPTNGINKCFTVFGDPARNLMSNYDHYLDKSRRSNNTLEHPNVTVPNVTFSGANLSLSASSTTPENSFSGFTSNISNPEWTISGAASFQDLGVLIPRKFPKIKARTNMDTLFLDRNFVIQLDTALFGNMDSLNVRISNSTSENAFGIQKTVAGNAGNITFNVSEYGSLSASAYAFIWFRAYNYSNKRQSNKTHVFELSSKARMPLMIKAN